MNDCEMTETDYFIIIMNTYVRTGTFRWDFEKATQTMMKFA